MSTVEEIRERCLVAGQGHLLANLGELNPEQQAGLLAQLAELDFDQLAKMRETILNPSEPITPTRFEPPRVFPLNRGAEEVAHSQAALERGADLFRGGQVGVVLVAGGQGSRLGFDGPKGRFPVGPVSDRTLFGWHAARLHAARQRYGSVAPLYIMTSATNDSQTKEFFIEQDYFGLGEDHVFFFTQRMWPALDLEGRVLLAAKDSLFLAPNGHGGTLEALSHSGALAHAQQLGVTCLSYIQVDSPVARPCDPLFVGLHALAGSQMSSKVVAKRDADEKVGVLGLADGTLGCIEYSDLPAELRNARDNDGQLSFKAGNIANHVINVDFIEQLTSGDLSLPWHLARKSMQVVGESGELEAREGVKFETFIFDALGETTSSVTLEVERAHEFSPIKNADGNDSPESCRLSLAQMFAGWVEAAGGGLPEPSSDGAIQVEVDPRVAECEAEFLGRWPITPRVLNGGHLYG